MEVGGSVPWLTKLSGRWHLFEVDTRCLVWLQIDISLMPDARIARTADDTSYSSCPTAPGAAVNGHRIVPVSIAMSSETRC